MKFSRVVKRRERRTADRWILAGIYSSGETKAITLDCFRTARVPTKEQVYPRIDLTVA